MDNKRLMIGMLAALAILLGWNFVVVQLAKKYNWDLGGPKPVATQPVQSTTVYGGPEATTATPAAPASTPSAPGALRVLPPHPTSSPPSCSARAQFKDPTWSMALETRSAGAAISSVTLNQFPAER